MLVFDSFPSRSAAIEFAAEVERHFNSTFPICDNQAESDAIDPFPFPLLGTIVLVDLATEEGELETLAEKQGGE